MSIYDIPLTRLDGTAASLDDYRGKVALVVNVASKCGMTPQYEGLEKLYERYSGDNFVVLGFPCNQFGAQEPGSPEEIAEFCTTNYGVTFPLFEKIDVNGDDRHPLYVELTKVADAGGHDGDIRWNFEKFLIGSDGEIVARFPHKLDPEAPEIVEAIEHQLPKN